MPWESNAPPAQGGCKHGDGTEEAVMVRMPVFPHRCPHHQFVVGQSWTFHPDAVTNPRNRGSCTHCGLASDPVRYTTVRDPTSGTMVIVNVMPTPGYSSNIYRCMVCGARYSTSPAFGAQGDTFFCGTAGNMWK